MQAILEHEGIAFHFSVQLRQGRARRRRRGVRVALDAGGTRATSSTAATCSPRSAGARTPTTSASTSAGIATDARGYIAVDDELRTNVPGVWALGDANGRGAFTHTSYNDHQIVADNLLRRRHSAASATASRPMRCSSTRRSAASA